MTPPKTVRRTGTTSTRASVAPCKPDQRLDAESAHIRKHGTARDELLVAPGCGTPSRVVRCTAGSTNRGSHEFNGKAPRLSRAPPF